MMARKTRKKKAESKITGIWIIFMVIFIAELFVYTWCRVNYIDMGYEISKETKKQHELIALQNNLKIELASLKSPERIAKIAKYQLGLEVPTKSQTIVIP
jgi:cell division protein FtsL